jgi:hypothetical protein
MKRTIKIVSIVLAVIIVLAIGTVLYDSGTFVSTEQLRTDGWTQLWTDPETHCADFYSGNVDVAEISVDVGLVMPQQDLAYMTFNIAHSVAMLGSPFDSLYLEFTPTNPSTFIQWYLEKPEAQVWPPMVFQTSSDGMSTIVGVDHLGLLGTGTLVLNFFLEPYQATSFWFEVNFTMHANGSLTRQAGESAQIEIPITYANAT